jgi:hypothetical protein
MAKKKRKDSEDLLVRIRKRYQIMTKADDENRNKAKDDLRFANVPGEQWDAKTREARGLRPCYEFNKLRVTIKRVVNEMRKNRPAGKVRAVEEGDKETADTLEGLCRNIWNVSDADTVIDYAGEYQVGGGMGAWRIATEYADDSAFEQDIVIEPIKNPFCLYADPTASDPLKRDALDWLLTDRISKASYKERYPDAEVVEFSEGNSFDDDAEWQDEETVRVCEYWYKEPYEKEIWLLETGQTVDSTAKGSDQIDPATIKKRRTAQCHRIKMCIASGNAILKEEEWAGREFPFIVIYGDWLVIEGKVHWSGLTRFAKDAQRSYNAARTAISETIAMAPQAKWWATPAQANGHMEMWNEAHNKNFPVMLFNPDPKAPNTAPQRMGGADVPVALIQESQIASEEIKAVTGIYDASLGAQSNETSGRAILSRQQQGEVATFNYSDNMGKGVRRTWEILIDLIPKIYDTERAIRILGVDGSEKYLKVNEVVTDERTGEPVTINDLSRGKYDVAVTVGPSFTTQRQEAAETYMNLAQAFPPLMQFAGDLVAKSMDLPYSDEIAERLQTMLPPPIQQLLSEGKQVPPEAQAAMAQANQLMEQVQQHGQLVQQAAQEAEQGKAEAEKAKSEVQQLMAQLETKKAQFDAHVAQKLADITLKEAQSTSSEQAQGAQQDREALAGEVKQAVADIQTMAGQFMQQAVQTMAEMQARTQPQVIVANPPKSKQVRVRRVNGELIGDVQEVA